MTDQSAVLDLVQRWATAWSARPSQFFPWPGSPARSPGSQPARRLSRAATSPAGVRHPDTGASQRWVHARRGT